MLPVAPSGPAGSRNSTHCTPKSTSSPAASTWPASLVTALRSKRSSIAPTRQMTPPATSTPRISVLDRKASDSAGRL